MGIYTVSTNSIALSAGVAKTAIRIVTPASRRAILRRLVVSDGSNDDTGLTARVGTGGTGGTGTDATPAPCGNAVAALSTAKIDFSAEPTGMTLRESYSFGAGSGVDQGFYGEEGVEVPHSSALNIVLTSIDARAAGEVSVVATFEE